MSAGSAETERSARTHDRVWPLWGLFLFSGAAGLIHQVVWGRAFTPIVGGTTRAAAVVVSAFFLGMALGNWLGGRWATDRAESLRRYALTEGLIAAGSLAVLGWLVFYRALYPALYGWGVEYPVVLPLAQAGLALLAMGPPSVAIGVTLPLMSRVVTDRLGRAGLRVGGAYAINTLGATCGALLAGFVLLGELGLRGSIMLAAGLNAAVAAAAWGLFRMGSVMGEPSGSPVPAEPPPLERDSRAVTAPPIPWAAASAAALSGGATLALEVFFVRLLVNRTDGSSHSFALILCVFLVSLAVGAACCAAMVDRIRNPWRIVAWGGSLAALGTFLAPLLFDFGRSVVGAAVAGVFGYWGGLALTSALVMGPTVVLAGLVLPALWRLATHELGDLGGNVGRLAAINTLAGVLGSLGAGFVLLPWVGIMHGFAVVALLFCAVGSIGWLCSSRGISRTVALAGMGVGTVLLLWADGWEVKPFTLRYGESLVHYEEGEAGSVAVARMPRGRLRLRVNDRYTLTSTARASRRTQRNMTRLALALVENPRSAAFIGVGGAISMSALTEFPSVERVLGMELIPGVLRAAPHFMVANRGILDDPRVEVLVADGRNHLRGRSERFDAVVGEIFSPWHAGTGYLYTAEHFEAVAQRLTDEGVFVQWLQSDQFSPEEARIVAATFLDAFPGAELWMSRRSGPVPLLGLVGRAPGAPWRDPEPIWTTKRSFPVRICDTQQLAAWADSAERNTDDRAIVEYRASWGHRQTRAGHKGSGLVARGVAEACGFEPASAEEVREDREGRSDREDGQDNGV